MIGVRPADGQGQEARRKRDQPLLAFTSVHALALIVLLVAGLAMSLTLLVQQAANLTQFTQSAISQGSQPNHDDGANDSDDSGDSGDANLDTKTETETENNAVNSEKMAEQPDGTSNGGAETAAGFIDLNSATSAELQTITGIGPVIAQRIIDHRTAIGRFESIEQLLDVKGIGAKTLENMRGQVMVQ
ncbi:ComEA family DNA-binding protein [Bifidobacterium oedipodis]|uniref:Competence protein ComEA n=1 Tax=Bifidobacterium oedipodis TaxID=2675322 RepID=A0A7Y0EQ48_9BIFI|nr:helix-hairpin-helix domain-containing protein [Bifidobacterium sp. DSM 109957]NMM94330.1 competence protein ComEA [Bifidobacterium sp. DSM 109957]